MRTGGGKRMTAGRGFRWAGAVALTAAGLALAAAAPARAQGFGAPARARGTEASVRAHGTEASARTQGFAALPAAGLAASVSGTARPLAAWSAFCAQYPGECALDRAEPAMIVLTPAVWQLVTGINRRVNRAVQAVTDAEHWGVPDRWDLAEDGEGDCEDYQLRKRQMLAAGGLPRRAMRMTVVIDEKGEGHAVLTLITDRGDLVLDNKTDAVLPWRQTGYTFVKRESQDALEWVGLGGGLSPTTTANR